MAHINPRTGKLSGHKELVDLELTVMHETMDALYLGVQGCPAEFDILLPRSLPQERAMCMPSEATPLQLRLAREHTARMRRLNRPPLPRPAPLAEPPAPPWPKPPPTMLYFVILCAVATEFNISRKDIIGGGRFDSFLYGPARLDAAVY